MNRREKAQLQEVLARRNLQQVDRTPEATDRQYCQHTGFEEASVDIIGQGFCVNVRLGGRISELTIDLRYQFVHVDLMYRRKERERLAWAVFTATTFESMAVKDASRIRTAFYNLSYAHVFVDRVHRFVPPAYR